MTPHIYSIPENPCPDLFTTSQYERLRANGEKHREFPGFDPKPVVKLFTPDGSAIWLLSEIYPDDRGVAFGLCDLGH